jgi:spore maturation protein CgeB
MKILCVFGEHNYGDPKRGLGYEYTNFIPAFRRLGHEVVFFESFNRSVYKSFSDLNRRFLMAVMENKPDVIFCVLMGYELWSETFAIVRAATDAVIVNWSTDDSWKYDQFSRFVIQYFDLYATTYPEAAEKGNRAGHRQIVLTQWAANAEKLYEPLPASKCRWDVSFVGTAYGNRRKWVSVLSDRGIHVSCFGHGWKNGPVDADAIPEIVRRSRISLNFGDSGWMLSGLIPYRSRQIKARVFEVPGYGGFLMTENANNLENFYRPGKEIVLFEDIDSLEKNIRFFLKHPEQRDQIARAGHTRTRQEHTYDRRFETLLHRVHEIQTERLQIDSLKAGFCGIDFARFNPLVDMHRPGTLLKCIRQLLITSCKLVWGRHRGPRAARRILFEISWRLCGKKTYSASGWPGRIFYRES